MILLVDNYDSFTFNLYQYLGELGADVKVVRNDALSADEALALNPEKIVISPGPGTPDEAGISLELVRRSPVPLLGVCLGHQALGQAFGGKVVRAAKLMHGKTSEIRHDGKTIFSGLPDVFTATRYHSLVVAPESVPECLEVSAWTDGAVVRMLSGWNCTPSSGRSRCRSPITTPPSVQAETSRHSGTLSGATTSEW